MPKPPFIVKELIKDTETITRGFGSLGYVADDELATILFLMVRLGKPLLLEGHPGVGKTEVANVLAAYLNTEVIRLQCYEGLDVNAAVYEWNCRSLRTDKSSA